MSEKAIFRYYLKYYLNEESLKDREDVNEIKNRRDSQLKLISLLQMAKPPSNRISIQHYKSLIQLNRFKLERIVKNEQRLDPQKGKTISDNSFKDNHENYSITSCELMKKLGISKTPANNEQEKSSPVISYNAEQKLLPANVDENQHARRKTVYNPPDLVSEVSRAVFSGKRSYSTPQINRQTASVAPRNKKPEQSLRAHLSRTRSNSDEENDCNNGSSNCFITAGEKLGYDGRKKKNSRSPDKEHYRGSGLVKRKFVDPSSNEGGYSKSRSRDSSNGGFKEASSYNPNDEDDDIDPRLKSCDPALVEKIEMEIIGHGDPIHFDDIAGLEFAKRCVYELVIWPMARPDIFTGLRTLPKGLLLFGPPGTGKTLIGKAIANESGATFFSISASSLTSKWIGEGEKLVRTLFAVAATKQPSVIFIDEIDSLLSQRSSDDNESSLRIKTEFLVQLDGAGTKSEDIVLVVGATNRPQQLDEAARRRFVKRLYIPLPGEEARADMVKNLLKKNEHDVNEENIKEIVEKSKGFSGADIRALCTEAAMGPIRDCVDIRTMDANSVRPIKADDFTCAFRAVRSSVSPKDLQGYYDWNNDFGSFQIELNDL